METRMQQVAAPELDVTGEAADVLYFHFLFFTGYVLTVSPQ